MGQELVGEYANQEAMEGRHGFTETYIRVLSSQRMHAFALGTIILYSVSTVGTARTWGMGVVSLVFSVEECGSAIVLDFSRKIVVPLLEH